ESCRRTAARPSTRQKRRPPAARRRPRLGKPTLRLLALWQFERLHQEPATEGRPPAVGNAELDAGRRPASDSAVTRILLAGRNAHGSLNVFTRNTAIWP